MKDLTGQVNGTDSILDTEWNPMYQEWKNIIVDMVAAMNASSSDQIGQALAEAVSRSNFYTGGGTAQAQTAAVVGGIQGLSKLTNGATVRWRPSVNNTGAAATVAVNGLTAKTILHEDGSAIIAGDLSTTRDAQVRYDGTNFRLQNITTVANSTALPKGFASGLTMGVNPADTFQNQDVRVAIGSCRDTANSANLVLTGTKDARWDANVAIGASTGGYPPALGTRVANSWYRFFIVGNVDGRVELGWDLAATPTATALLAAYNAIGGESGWSYYRQLGWTRTTTDILLFSRFHNPVSDPSLFLWNDGGLTAGYADYDIGITGSAARTTATLDFAAPESVALIQFYAFNKANSGSASGALIATPIGAVDYTPTFNNSHARAYNPGSNGGSSSTPSTNTNAAMLGNEISVQLDSSRQFHIRWYASAGNFYPYGNVRGYRYER